jgi:hypothetical protein
MGAFFPGDVREALKDSMAESGITIEDLREMLKKAGGGRAWQTLQHQR